MIYEGKTTNQDKYWMILIIGWVFVAYEYALRVSDSVILPQLQEIFHLTPSNLSLLSSGYYFAYVIFMLPAGVIIDRIGLYRAWLVAIGILVFGSVLFSLSNNIEMFIIARVLMGVGSSFAVIGVFAQCVKSRYSGLLIGITMGMCMLGVIVGQGPWSAASSYLCSWSGTYRYSAIFGMIIWIAWLIYGRCSMAISPVVLMNNIRLTLSQLFKSPIFYVLALFICVLSTPQTVFMALWGPRYLSLLYHLPETMASYINSLISVGGLVGAILLGWLSDVLHNYIKSILVTVGLLTVICFAFVFNNLLDGFTSA